MEDPKKLEEGYGASKNEEVQAKGSSEEAGHDSIEAERKNVITSEVQVEETKQKPKRVATLDAFRGLTIVVTKAICL